MITGNSLDGLVFARTKLSMCAFCEAMGLSRSTAYQWRRRGISKQGAITAEIHFDGAIKAHELRPDIFIDPENFHPSVDNIRAVNERMEDIKPNSNTIKD